MKTKQMKTSELTGPALDWAVAKCEGADEIHFGDAEQFLLLHSDPIKPMYHFCDDWSQGGPIIEREKIGFWAYTLDEEGNENPGWCAETFEGYCQTGATPLVAAMRCFVASKLGDEVEIPQDLV